MSSPVRRETRSRWHSNAAGAAREIMHKRLKSGDDGALEWLRTERELRLNTVSPPS